MVVAHALRLQGQRALEVATDRLAEREARDGLEHARDDVVAVRPVMLVGRRRSTEAKLRADPAENAAAGAERGAGAPSDGQEARNQDVLARDEPVGQERERGRAGRRCPGREQPQRRRRGEDLGMRGEQLKGVNRAAERSAARESDHKRRVCQDVDGP